MISAGRIRSYFGRVRRFSPNARLYLAGTFLMGFGQGAIFVHLNLYFRALGLGDAFIGRLLSISSFGTVVIALPAALWIDRLPAQRVFTLAAAGFSLALGAILLWPTPAVLVAASFLSGLMFTVHWVAAPPFFMRNSGEEERIYLFGSEARGEAGPDSDLDFCVVVADDAPVELFRDGGIYSLLRGMGYPKDIVPWRRSDFDARAAHVRASLPATVVREGKLLYDSRPVAA